MLNERIGQVSKNETPYQLAIREMESKSNELLDKISVLRDRLNIVLRPIQPIKGIPEDTRPMIRSPAISSIKTEIDRISTMSENIDDILNRLDI